MPHSGSGNDRWLLTYSDLITLLLAFFIILYAMSELDNQKYARLAQGLATAFGGNVPNGTLINGANKLLTEDEQFELVMKDIEAYMIELSKCTQISMHVEERGLVISINANLFFPIGSAVLTSESKDILTRVAEILTRIPNHIRIEGHTDNVPIKTRDYPSNWQLSTARATNVITYLIEQMHYNPARLSAAGYGEYRPVESNDTAAGRSRNRRVDVVVIRNKYAGVEPGNTETTQTETP